MEKGRFYFLEFIVNNRVSPDWARRKDPNPAPDRRNRRRDRTTCIWVIWVNGERDQDC